ncbi:MAG: hypothetical protein ACE5JH_03520 [Acidobacteriota bacterium]
MTKTRKAPGKKKSAVNKGGMVDFQYGNIAYQIDPSRRKVYQRWVEVETAKTHLIMGAYDQAHPTGAV